MEEDQAGEGITHADGEIEAVEAIGRWCDTMGMGAVGGRVAAALMAHAGPLAEREVARCAGVSVEELRPVVRMLVASRMAKRLPDERVAWEDDAWARHLERDLARMQDLRAMLDNLRPRTGGVLARRIDDTLAFVRFWEAEGPCVAARWQRESEAAARDTGAGTAPTACDDVCGCGD